MAGEATIVVGMIDTKEKTILVEMHFFDDDT